MNAQLLRYGPRISGDHMRYCSICGKPRPTEHGKFVTHTTPQGKPCDNSGQSVKKVNQEAQG